MKASNLTVLSRKTLALVCCVSVLLVTTSSQALWLNCDCTHTAGPEPSCCCTQVDVEEIPSSCCPSIPHQWTQVHEDFRQHSECDHCGCFDVPLGSDFSPYIHSVPSTPGDQAYHPLANALCPAVEPLVGDGKIVVDNSLTLPAAAGNLDTVVLQL